MKLLALIGDPNPSKRTAAAVDAFCEGAESAGAVTTILQVEDGSVGETLVASIAASDAVVFASPTYRAGVSWVLKSVIDQLPRGFNGEPSVLQGKACATILTGASDHHFLGGDGFRAVLAGFYAAQVLSPGLYFSRSAFDSDGVLLIDQARLARAHGRALVEFGTALKSCPAVSALAPLV